MTWAQAFLQKIANWVTTPHKRIKRWDYHFKVRKQQTRISTKEILHHMSGNCWRFTVQRFFFFWDTLWGFRCWLWIPMEVIRQSCLTPCLCLSGFSNMQIQSRRNWCCQAPLYFVNIFQFHSPIRVFICHMVAQAGLCLLSLDARKGRFTHMDANKKPTHLVDLDLTTPLMVFAFTQSGLNLLVCCQCQDKLPNMKKMTGELL